jgi:integrase
MAVVPRKRKTGPTVYYAVNDWPQKPGKSKQQAEKVGTSKRDAEVRDRAMKKEIAAGTYVPPSGRARDTVGIFGPLWLDQRTNTYAATERQVWARYVTPRTWLMDLPLEDVEPVDHIDRLVAELRAERKDDGSRRLTDKTIANLLGILSLMFDAAVRARKCLRNPVVLAPRTLKRSPQREKEIYQPGEVAVLVAHHRIPWPVRVLNAFCEFAGFRMGEACGRRIRDLDLGAPILPAITVRDQYNGLPLKTERPRIVPMHPLLREVLEAWLSEGFELYTGRKPTPDDFVVPAIGARAKQPCWTRSQYYKAFVETAKLAGVRPRSVHSTRHTFISLCRRGGARKDVLERITHNARGDMVDQYTHLDWEPLCEAVLCLRLDAHPGPQLPPGSGGNPGALPPAAGSTIAQESPVSASGEQSSIPRASTTKQHKNQGLGESRQETRQVAERVRAEFSAANRKRKRELLTLAEIDPEGAAPGLAICRALDAQLVGNTAKAVAILAKEARRHG